MSPLRLPPPRGPLSTWVLDLLAGRLVPPPPPVDRGAGHGDDLHLALYLAYETAYRGLPGAVDDAGRDPALVELRNRMEDEWARTLRELVEGVAPARHRDVRDELRALVAADDGPSLSRHVERDATLDEARDVIVHRAAYQSKEADGHTFAIPHLRGRAKQLLVTIQAGEYGADAPGREAHSALFARTLRALGLDDRPNAHLARQPASALAISNLVSLLGLHHRWRGALVGHLALFEMTSVEPMGRYSRGLERLGLGPDARRFYDVHVLADAEHEHLALDMAAALVADEPALRDDVRFGARCVLATERWFAEDLFARWRERTPAAAAA